MANVKWTEFPAASTISGSDLIPIVQSGTNKKATGTIFATYIGTLFVSLSAEQTIAGVKTFSSQLASSVATGTAPFSIASTTKVTNLNADLLDGYTSADFQLALTNPITGTGTTNYLPKFTGTSALGNSLIYDDGSGIGIGTTSPNYTTSGRGVIDVNGSSQSMYALSVGGVGKAFLFYTGADLLLSNESAGEIKFNTNGSQKAVITSAGNVGIGTASPNLAGASKGLSINSSGYTTLELNQNDTRAFFVYSDAAQSFLGTFGAAPLIFRTNDTDRMRITSSGNFGFGTATPDVFGRGYSGTILGISSAGQSAIELNSATGNAAYFDMGVAGTRTFSFYTDTSSSDISTIGAFPLTLSINSVPRLTIASSGAATFSSSVTANGTLTVNEDGASTKIITIRSNWAGVDPAINVTTNNSLLLMTNNTERMRITSAGLVGIGTASPAGQLDVGSGYQRLLVTYPSTYVTKLSIGAGAFIQQDASNEITTFEQTYSAGKIDFNIGAGSTKVRIANTGNVLIGTTTDAGYKLDVNGTARVVGTLGSIFTNSAGNELHFTRNGNNYIVNDGASAGFGIYTGGSNLSFLLTPSGAATFSSSVTAGAAGTIGSQLTSTANYSAGINFIQTKTDATDIRNFRIITDQQTYATFNIQKSTTLGGSTYADLMYFNQAGAAIFSSSVQTGGQILVNTGTANQNTTISGSKVGMSRTSDGAEVVYFSKNTDLGAEGTANINGYNGIQFRTQGAESVKVTIKENGNLLVNKTTDVGYKLDVFGTTRLDPQGGEYGLVVGRASGMVNIRAGSDDGGYLLMDSAGEGGMVGLNWYSSENVILANGGGKVGIGNSSPIHKLSVDGKIGGTIFGDSYVEFTSIGHTIIKANNDVFLGYSQDCIVTQSGQLAVGTTSPDASAKVQIDSTTQGFLVPRMLESEINAISSPATGLLVYNTDQNHMCMYDGSVWKKFSMSNM